jgi:hypothetical protein
MSSLSILNDHEAETINGGWYRSYAVTKRATTYLSQKNTSTNIALGLGGYAYATSYQMNVAGINTVIG